ncbi:MAG: hypothetical protein K0V04_21615 [Deltaproteobacteria bacterium]|nr:hypothetical protein [Deltaproteobacteria bacterium]
MPLGRADGIAWVRIGLEVEGEPRCEESDDPTLYGIYIDPDLSFDTVSEEPIFGVMDPQMQISARCQGGALTSDAGSVTVEPGPTEDSALIVIDARSEEIPAQFHWVGFVAGRESLQLAPAAPAVEVASISTLARPQ